MLQGIFLLFCAVFHHAVVQRIVQKRSNAIHGEHEDGTSHPLRKEGDSACEIPRRPQTGPGI